MATLLFGLLAGVLVGGLAAAVILRRPAAADPAAAGEPVAPAGQQPASSDLNAFADGLGVGALWLDREHVVTAANDSAHLLLDRKPPALVGLSALGAFLDHRVEELLGRAAGGRAEMELATVGEPQRTLLLTAAPSGGGTWLVTVSDVSELRRLQRIRSEFIDNLAHELRTPLTTIRLLTETLRDNAERVDLPTKMRERVAKIDVETGHLVQMVNELLDLSRIEGGASGLHLARVDLREVIEGAVDRLRTFADRQRVQLVVHLAPGDTPVPAALGDAERLGQVLVNLLHNAIKFSPPETTVSVTVHARPTEIAIAVRDQGVGIPRADRDRVFERFYKADKARERGPGGTGLGLAIARHIVEGHGGRIWVDSEEGRGATFTFTVPAAGQAAAG